MADVMQNSPDVRERIARAIMQDPDFWVRVNKDRTPTTFEVVDRRDELIVISRHAHAADAHAARDLADARARADAAYATITLSDHIAAVKAAGLIVMKLIPGDRVTPIDDA
jgi:hypothetical protein